MHFIRDAHFFASPFLIYSIRASRFRGPDFYATWHSKPRKLRLLPLNKVANRPDWFSSFSCTRLHVVPLLFSRSIFLWCRRSIIETARQHFDSSLLHFYFTFLHLSCSRVDLIFAPHFSSGRPLYITTPFVAKTNSLRRSFFRAAVSLHAPPSFATPLFSAPPLFYAPLSSSRHLFVLAGSSLPAAPFLRTDTFFATPPQFLQIIFVESFDRYTPIMSMHAL